VSCEALAKQDSKHIMPVMYYVYILQSQKDQSMYIGSTESVKQRLADHNSGKAKYSSSKRPYTLKWFCAFPNKTIALKFEKYLKQGSGFAFARKHLL
jgi:predicted GIY-YIG superfamily endonuclease